MLKEFGGNIAKTSRNTNIDRISLDSNKDFKNIVNCVLFFCFDYKPWACTCFSNFLSKTSKCHI